MICRILFQPFPQRVPNRSTLHGFVLVLWCLWSRLDCRTVVKWRVESPSLNTTRMGCSPPESSHATRPRGVKIFQFQMVFHNVWKRERCCRPAFQLIIPQIPERAHGKKSGFFTWFDCRLSENEWRPIYRMVKDVLADDRLECLSDTVVMQQCLDVIQVMCETITVLH